MIKESRAHYVRPDGPYSSVRLAKRCGHIARRGRLLCRSCTAPIGASWACVVCGAEITGSPSLRSRKITCSPTCRSKRQSGSQRGAASHLWRGGKTAENRCLRNSSEAECWRAEVMAAADYTCALCGERGGRLTADHVIPWSLAPELRYDRANGRCLCWGCHGLLPTTGARVVQLRKFVTSVSDGQASLHCFALAAMFAGPRELWPSGQRAALALIDLGLANYRYDDKSGVFVPRGVA